MTAGEIIRAARTRANLSQLDLAKLLQIPRTQITRWEAGQVDPGFSTVRRVLRACGFDLSMELQPYAPDHAKLARLAELATLTPKERLDAALERATARWSAFRFDPYALMRILQDAGIDYILVGTVARILHGTDEIPDERLDVLIRKKDQGDYYAAVRAHTAWMPLSPVDEPHQPEDVSFLTRWGELYSTLFPPGTKGFGDIRRKAQRIHLGGGLQPRLAAVGDLVRIHEASAHPSDGPRLEALRQLTELPFQ